MNISLYSGIMAFYAVLTYFIFPMIFYYTMGKTAKAAGQGFVLGSVVSVALWFFYGSKMVV
jgi:hypothetical protein